MSFSLAIVCMQVCMESDISLLLIQCSKSTTHLPLGRRKKKRRGVDEGDPITEGGEGTLQMLNMLLSCQSTWLHSFFADFTTAEIGAAFFRSSFCAFHVFFLFLFFNFSGRGMSLLPRTNTSRGLNQGRVACQLCTRRRRKIHISTLGVCEGMNV